MDIVARSKFVMLAMGAAPVMYLMLALSLISQAIVVERFWFFRRVSGDVKALSHLLSARLSRGDLEAARMGLAKSASVEAAVVRAGLEQADLGPRAAAEAMTGALALQRLRLEKGLAYLGTLGNNAPFIGLFGTVIGIIMAFEKLGQAGAMAGAASGSAPGEVMASIAEALVATAIGLAVAIPAVAAYNYFQRRIKSILAATDALSRLLLSFLEGVEFEERLIEESSDRQAPEASRDEEDLRSQPDSETCPAQRAVG